MCLLPNRLAGRRKLDKAERGYQAQVLLENPLLKEILSALDGEYHTAWRDAKTVEAREDLYRYVKVLERIAVDLKSVAMTGMLERKRLDELEAKKRTLWPTNR